MRGSVGEKRKKEQRKREKLNRRERKGERKERKEIRVLFVCAAILLILPSCES
ncbi:MAG: hypothetical protein AVDCRST_MAG56-6936 [uncultured Cytophagales bacterium]|uniref:Uncharacterized protein n=1 Tax=uncultured Cytophagales bacterium TaxID=158755 RepID=A0A6J4L1N6_9SPHI|nr:MAG: hypothetical protein AVDCRST_MAG56-6936 [uncultured Cytophagales bacterium]